MATNYPNKSFTRALEVAEHVNDLGGKCNLQTLAEKMDKKIGGSFHDDVNAAVKFDLILKEKDLLRLSDRFTEIELAYTDDEKQQFLRNAFLLPDLYREVLARFKGKPLPIDVLDKMLIREYDVSKSISKTVGRNLIKGGENVELIQDGKVIEFDFMSTNSPEQSDEGRPVATAVAIEPTKRTQRKKVDRQQPTSSIPEGKKSTSITSIKEELSTNSNISLNINIQLTVPETTNEEVYEKFFAAMKKHLLS